MKAFSTSPPPSRLSSSLDFHYMAATVVLSAASVVNSFDMLNRRVNVCVCVFGAWITSRSSNGWL